MKTELECLPCFFRQIERVLARTGVNGDRGRDIVRRAGALVEQASLEQAPARTTTLLHRLLNEAVAVDPFLRDKREYNTIALDLLPAVRRMAQEHRSSFGRGVDLLEGGVRAAIAGNIIDFGIYDTIDLNLALRRSFSLPLPEAAYLKFSEALDRAGRVLYLCDNAGEIVFDRVLIETLRGRGKKVTAVVKGRPVINDATRADAEAVLLHESADAVIDNGNDGIGTLLELMSAECKAAYDSADMIISKGQANYETLIQTGDSRIYYLFMVKCSVVARALGRDNGDIMLLAGAGTC